MNLKAALLCLALAAPLAPAAAVQQPAADAAADDIARRIISNPNPQSYRLDGVRSGGGVRRDPGVQGGKALRVPVSGRSEQAWSVSVAVPITRAVKAGDNLVLAFWARLERGDNGATSSVLPYNAVQMAGAPYTALFTGPATIGPEWRMHEIRGRANRDYAAGELNVSIHLATARHTVDIGPVFVLNMEQ
ncbi:MAG TPA: hypothetical protein VGB79_07780 [Allosphingosinicella sp.]|jgi:hypothetical protein